MENALYFELDSPLTKTWSWKSYMTYIHEKPQTKTSHQEHISPEPFGIHGEEIQFDV